MALGTPWELHGQHMGTTWWHLETTKGRVATPKQMNFRTNFLYSDSPLMRWQRHTKMKSWRQQTPLSGQLGGRLSFSARDKDFFTTWSRETGNKQSRHQHCSSFFFLFKILSFQLRFLHGSGQQSSWWTNLKTYIRWKIVVSKKPFSEQLSMAQGRL